MALVLIQISDGILFQDVPTLNKRNYSPKFSVYVDQMLTYKQPQ